MAQFIIACFMWLPYGLRLIVGAVVTLFFLFLVFDILRFLIDLFKFLLDCLGGFFGKVVTFFV